MSENTLASGKKKRRAPRTAYKPGQSGNPGGRPKKEVSLTYWLKEFGKMTPRAAAKLCAVWAKALNAAGDDLPIAGMAALQLWMQLINDANPKLMQIAFDRIDGKLTIPFENVSEAALLERLSKAGISLDDARNDPLLAGLFELVTGRSLDAVRQAPGAVGDKDADGEGA